MFFFRSRKRVNREVEIAQLKKGTLKKIDEASKSVKKVNQVLDRDDITLRIFYATRRKGIKQ